MAEAFVGCLLLSRLQTVRSGLLQASRIIHRFSLIQSLICFRIQTSVVLSLASSTSAGRVLYEKQCNLFFLKTFVSHEERRFIPQLDPFDL